MILMNTIKESIKSELHTGEPLQCKYECYLLKKRRFLVFLNGMVTKENLIEICRDLKNCFQEAEIKGGYNDCKTIIVVAQTNNEFKSAELELFDNDNTVVTFYLIDCDKQNSYYVKSPGPFMFGLSYTKFIKRINNVVDKEFHKQ